MKNKVEHTKLGQFSSTAISGNDILSSALYVSGIAAIFAGVYAPLALLAVAIVLFFYRTVYREVVEALPINGGAYNALLNSTGKPIAATAGVMTILSYIATAVISAKTAVEYLFKFIENIFHTNYGTELELEHFVIPTVIVVLFLFALLIISGVKDSAKVALGIFIFHIVSLTVFVIWGLLSIQSFDLFNQNYLATQSLITSNGGIIQTLFFAFSACLLGVSGFESSANFVEEQKKGVFKKTLRNMLIGVAIFNPLISLVTLNVLSMNDVAMAKDFLLAEASFKIGGIPLLAWISIDAFLVLCGAVLTSFIGVSGLVSRMALDDTLPVMLVKQNSKGSFPRIVLAFFVLCTSILVMTNGNLLSLAGVYTISFLCVMTLFAVGNLLLRVTRRELKRPYKAPIFYVFIALLSTSLGLIGNSLIDPANVAYFLVYFVPSIFAVMIIIFRTSILRAMMYPIQNIKPIFNYMNAVYQNSINPSFYVFVHHTNRLHTLLEYIDNNENGTNVVIIHCKNGDDKQLERIQQIIPELQEAGAFPNLKISFEYNDECFGPECIDNFAKERNINKNRIFIGSIHEHHDFDYGDLGGVRIVSS
jgi:amino acid transporter